jgi:hypothetical protein
MLEVYQETGGVKAKWRRFLIGSDGKGAPPIIALEFQCR